MTEPQTNPLVLYVATLVRVMSWRVPLALTLMISLSLAEGVSLLLLVPLLQLAGLDVQGGAVGQVAGFVESVFTFTGLPHTLFFVLSVFVLVFSGSALLQRWQNNAIVLLQYGFALRLRQDLFRAVTNTDWLFFSRMRSSDFTHALTTEIDRIAAATHYVLSLFVNIAVASVYLAFALRLSVAATGVAIVGGAGLLLLLKRKRRSARLTGEAQTLVTKGLYAAAIEHLAGMKTAKGYGAEERNAGIFADLSNRVAGIQTAATKNNAEVKFWFDVGTVLILSMILILLTEVLTVPTAGILLILFLFARIMPKISGIQQSYQYFVNALPAFANVMLLQARCEAAAEMKWECTERVALQQSLCLEQVSFAYEMAGSPLILHNVDLEIRAGETTAIVGQSGAGKSTIADLVIGLITPTQGGILLDGTVLDAARMRAWRDQVGYVTQDTFLFHDTVRANLLWACPGRSDIEIGDALRLAAVEDVILGLPEGLDTILGDRGVRLSGGEKQRLALARALLRNPSLLILDEATSNLDSENEEKIQLALDELRGRLTMLIISHRLPTVRDADTIYVLDRGRLIESGSWHSLLSREKGRFRGLCSAQGIDADDNYTERPAPALSD